MTSSHTGSSVGRLQDETEQQLEQELVQQEVCYKYTQWFNLSRPRPTIRTEQDELLVNMPALALTEPAILELCMATWAVLTKPT